MAKYGIKETTITTKGKTKEETSIITHISETKEKAQGYIYDIVRGNTESYDCWNSQDYDKDVYDDEIPDETIGILIEKWNWYKKDHKWKMTLHLEDRSIVRVIVEVVELNDDETDVVTK